MHSAQTVLDRAVNWWRTYRETRSDLAEFHALSPQDVNDLVAASGVSAETLVKVIRAGRHGSDEMTVMMQALNIDPGAVQTLDHRLFVDMQVVCATCEHKGQCRHDLETGSAAQDYHHYCGNADTLDALRATPAMMLAE